MQMDNYTWLPVKDAAKLLCKEVSTVQKMCKSGKCKSKLVPGKGRGGQVLMIALESLTPDIQDLFLEQQYQESNDFMNSLTDAEREKINFKRHVVMEYRRFKAESHSGRTMNAFLEQFHRKNPAASITSRQVADWNRRMSEQGIQGLYDSRGVWHRGQDSTPEEAWNTFYSLWFNFPRATIQMCYDMTCEKHKDEFPQLPSIRTFGRKLERLPASIKILRREGKKAFDDKCMPHMNIDYENMHSNEQWVADHHIFDVMVEDEKGNIFRPWLSGWIDRKSRYVVGYEVNSCAPNADIVLSSFARACIRSGIPESVLLDNGKDYKAYDLFNNSNAMSIAGQMGIKVHNAIVKNAKAKPIERYFKTLEERYMAMLPSYIAGKPHIRPDKMNMTNKKLKQKSLCIPYADFLKIVDQAIQETNNTAHQGDGMQGKTPYQIYMESFEKPARMVKNEDVLNLLLQRTSRPIKVGRNGIKVPNLGFWYNDIKLFEWIGKEVYARYNPDDVSKVLVYSDRDVFICVAQSSELAVLGSEASIQLLKEYNKARKERREMMKEWLPGKADYSLQEFLESRSRNHQAYDVRKDAQAIPLTTRRYRDVEQITVETEAAEVATSQPEETVAQANTLSFEERQRRKRERDDALYQFITQGGMK